MEEKDNKVEILSLVKERKKTNESYVVLAMYKNIDLYLDSNLTLDSFDVPVWKFYFGELAKAVSKDIKVIDDVSLSIIISEGGQDTSSKYEKFGGWNTIEQGKDLVVEENFESYLKELQKLNAILKLMKSGLMNFQNVQQLEGVLNTSVDKIQETIEKRVANCFEAIASNEKVEDLKDNLWQIVEDANEEKYRGFPYKSALWNEYTNGMSLGNITMLSANSGVGKTFMAIAQIFPTFIELNEKLTILANEEDSSKWKQAIIVWVANNVFDGNFDKKRFQKGRFTKEEMTLLKKATDWLSEKMKSKQIEFIAFSSFTMKKSIKIIRKQAITKGVKYFILDTLKSDADAKETEQVWQQLQNNMVKLYDAIKTSTLNRHVFVTYQLGKSAVNKRYLDQSNLGVSKNVVDVVSTLLLSRRALDVEKGDGGLAVKEIDNDAITKYMNKDKDYFITFLGKNRMGSTIFQLVQEVDMARNIVKDFGVCKIEADFSG